MKIAVVGLGRMGRALARRFLTQGIDVVVWNRSAGPLRQLVAAGALAADDQADVWNETTAVCTFLADDAAARNVLVGERSLVARAPSHCLLIELSTISPTASSEIAQTAEESGVRYLRAPVSGNPDVLMAGNLSLIVSGDEADFQAARPIMSRIGSSARYVGIGETARVLKLAVNAMLAGTAQLLSEAVVLTEAFGMDRSTVLEVLQNSAVGSPFLRYKETTLLNRDYAATFTLSMLLKDLRLVQRLADLENVPLPICDLVAQLTKGGCDEGFGELDLLALLPHLQRAAHRPVDVDSNRNSRAD